VPDRRTLPRRRRHDDRELTPASALIGGALIDLSATLLLWLTGRIAGVSGLVAPAAQRLT
jgi:hypothetical protein